MPGVRAYNPDVLGIQGARPYGPTGNLPTDAIKVASRPGTYTDAPLRVSGIPYVPDEAPEPAPVAYADRPLCSALRKDGEPCKGKAQVGKEVCKSHEG